MHENEFFNKYGIQTHQAAAAADTAPTFEGSRLAFLRKHFIVDPHKNAFYNWSCVMAAAYGYNLLVSLFFIFSALARSQETSDKSFGLVYYLSLRFHRPDDYGRFCASD